MMPEKLFVFKQKILFQKIKFGGEIERIWQDLFQRISGSGKWTQKLDLELSFESESSK